MFKVKEHPTDKWLQVNRKPDNDLNPGDQVYGEIGAWPDGNPKFIRMQPPQGQQPQRAQATQTAPQSTGGSIDSKLDYIISLLENQANFQGNGQTSSNSGDYVPTDVDSGPVDLSQLDY